MPTKLEYLQQYMSSNGASSHDKKKKKSRDKEERKKKVKNGQYIGLKVIDDEDNSIDFNTNNKIKLKSQLQGDNEDYNKFDLNMTEADEQPVIVNLSEFQDEIERMNSGQNKDTIKDASPPRRRRDKENTTVDNRTDTMTSRRDRRDKGVSSDNDTSPQRRKRRAKDTSHDDVASSPLSNKRVNDTDSGDDASLPHRYTHVRKGTDSSNVVSPPHRNRRANDTRSDDDASPPRRNTHANGTRSDDDASPPRRNRYANDNGSGDEASPPRRNRHANDSGSGDDAPPPRRYRRANDTDIDVPPPRKNSHTKDTCPENDASPPRRSHHGEYNKQDLNRESRHRRRESKNSTRYRKYRDRSLSPDFSTSKRVRSRSRSNSLSSNSNRSSRHSDRSDRHNRRKYRDSGRHSHRERTKSRSRSRHREYRSRSKHRTHETKHNSYKHRERSPETAINTHKHQRSPSKIRKTGLFKASEISTPGHRNDDKLAHVSGKDLGEQAETVYRDRKGRKLDMLNEMMLQEEIRQGKRKREAIEAYEWGTGNVQKELKKSEEEMLEIMKSKPFARLADDDELEEMRKNRARTFDDPINSAVFKADLNEAPSSKGKKKKMKKNMKPKYNGPPAPSNRFGILPGYRWDGVVRGTNWEARILEKHTGDTAKSEEAYRLAVADM